MSDTLRDVESVIFDLRTKASLFLRAANTVEFDHIQDTISHLQKLYGAVSGVKRRQDARTA